MQVEDVSDDQDTEVAGPNPPPDEDPDDYGPDLPPDDDEGRFFGGGISKTEEEILDFVDEQGNDGRAQDRIDSAWLRKTSLNFEKRITKNAELRAKFEGEPQKFIASEADLDADIKALSILSEYPALYPEFARLGCVASLVGLLAHENTDIAIDAVEIIGELTDEDVAAEEEQWGALADALMEADLVGLLVSNFSRLNEDDEADRSGVYHALSVIENLCSRTSTAEQIGQDLPLLQWLLGRIQRKESPTTQNKQYAAEILAILAQTSAKNRRKLADSDAADVMLQLVASYRRRDPEKGGEEEEYMENLFEALTCVVDDPEGKAKFLQAEGVELCLIMLKEGKASKQPALRLLHHAADGMAAVEVCETIVEAAGLKTLFTTFMKTHDGQTTEHLLGIFASMLRLLPAQSAERIRTLAKFVEKDYAKTERLVKLRGNYAAAMGLVDKQITDEKRGMDEEEQEDMAPEWLSRRLDAGLFNLQTIDIILAWLAAEDDGIKRKIRVLLSGRSDGLAGIKSTLMEQLDSLDLDSADDKDTRDMLTTLIEFL
jgi:beta-catenin-like protein 1